MRLGEFPLKVISASSSEIVASLPAGLAAGSYRLVVMRGKDESLSDRFELAIGGPPGPPDGACVDADGDGFFAAPAVGTCPGAVDCNDQNPAVWPGAPETCDGLDNDCNGATDIVSCGEGVCAAVANICAMPACSPRLELQTSELCSDGLDNDCDGSIDDGIPIQPTLAGAFTSLFSLLEGLGGAGAPASCGGTPAVCCTGGNPLSDCGPFETVLTAPPVVVATSDPFRFDYSARMRIKSIQAIPVSLPGADCSLAIDTAPGSVPFVEIRGQMSFAPVLGQFTFPTLSGVAITNHELADVDLSGVGISTLTCAAYGAALSLSVDVLSGAVDGHFRERTFGLCKP